MHVIGCYSSLLIILLATQAQADERLFARLDINNDGLLAANEIDEQHRRLFERLLRTADDDRDGQLTREEFEASLQSKQAEKPLVEKLGSQLPGTDALLLLLAKMDANTNGQIEKDEVPSQFREVFDRIEERVGGERDGVLDRRELTQSAPQLSQIAMRIAQRMQLDIELELALLSDKQWRSVQTMVKRPQRGEQLADAKRAQEFFRQIDTNGDGIVTMEEVPEAIADRFEQLLARADRNRDEQLTEAELMAVSRRLQTMAADRPEPEQRRADVARLLKQLDTDGDGTVSRAEAPRRLRARFERLDRDGNGQLGGDELNTLVEVMERMRRAASQQSAQPERKRQPAEKAN